ncbi:MAG: tetratricopeptide (TPR) repeat protein [Myxococcota bacterium]|jgi:tetratricopeptide (TPR) repeat protein
MNRAERLGLCLERLSAEVDDLSALVDTERLLTGEPEELLVAAARIEAALPCPAPIAEAELALLFMAGRDYARARRHAAEAARPESTPEVAARGHALLGRLAEVAEEPHQALDHYRQAVDLNPRSWRHRQDLAAILIELPDLAAWSEAEDSLAAAAALAGETDGIALIRAQLMLAQGDQEGARRTLIALAREGAVRFAAMAAALLARLPRPETDAVDQAADDVKTIDELHPHEHSGVDG